MNIHTFYKVSNNRVYAYAGETIESNRDKIYSEIISESTFSVSEEQNSDYILNFQEMIEYMSQTMNDSNELIISNLSQASVEMILTLCNEKIRVSEQEDDTRSSHDRIVDTANARLLELFGITYEEFLKLTCLEQNELMEQLYMNREEKGSKKIMIGSGTHSMFTTKQKGERVMLADGTFIRVGDNPYQRRKRLNAKLDSIVKYEKSIIRKLMKKS